MTGLVWSVSGMIFTVGMAVLIFRRELIAMLLGLELMAVAVNLNLAFHAGLYRDTEALAAVFLVIAVVAAEAVVGLSLILKVRKLGRLAETTEIKELHG